ncbi:MAG: hypothetical protein JRJ66_16675 [Deltaproteobacteria bacterium]|nr:hypothetical protein [Deltaproteobacteria bacterium]
MTTSLYLPLEEFVVNGQRGESLLLNELLKTGPCYRLIVHESEEWLKLKEVYEYYDRIEVIPNKLWEEYTEISEKFFEPLIDGIKYVEYGKSKYHPKQLVTDLSRALFLIMVGNRYNARIYDSHMISDTIKQLDYLEKNREHLNEDGFERLEAFSKLIRSYQGDWIEGISQSGDYDVYKDVSKLLSYDKIKYLSEKNYKLGILGENFNEVKLEIKEAVTEIIKSNFFPWIIETTYHLMGIGLNEVIGSEYYHSLGPTLSLLTKEIQGLDFREYAPPVVRERFLYVDGVFMSQPVNSKVYFLTEKR